MARWVLATVGAVKTAAVWAGPTAVKKAFRSACIKSTLQVAVPVGVERSVAVYAGTRVSNYVTGGLIPGALTVLVIYDGWCLARGAYNWLNSEQE